MMFDKSQFDMFDINAYWDLDKYSSQEYERLNQILQSIPDSIGTVLDVGCGNGFITNQIHSASIVVGVDRSFTALKHVKFDSSQADIRNLPFDDDSFDLVIASEVIEHLPITIYHKSLSELVRVAKANILLTTPYKEDLAGAQVYCTNCYCVFHPYHHMRSFSEHDLKYLFDDFGSTVTLIILKPIYKTYTLFPYPEIHRLRGSKAPFTNYSICPQCGASPKVNDTDIDISTSLSRLVKRIKNVIKQNWPLRKHTYIWFLALYELSK